MQEGRDCNRGSSLMFAEQGAECVLWGMAGGNSGLRVLGKDPSASQGIGI